MAIASSLHKMQGKTLTDPGNSVQNDSSGRGQKHSRRGFIQTVNTYRGIDMGDDSGPSSSDGSQQEGLVLLASRPPSPVPASSVGYSPKSNRSEVRGVDQCRFQRFS